MTEIKPCGGGCCRAFTLPVSYEEMRRAYSNWQCGCKDEMQMSTTTSMGLGRQRRDFQDIHLIFPMLVPLGPHKTYPQGFNSSIPVEWYTCKHFDKETSLCTIYDIRPAMCRDYPYGRRCEYRGCNHPSALTEEEWNQEFIKRQKTVEEEKKERESCKEYTKESKDEG